MEKKFWLTIFVMGILMLLSEGCQATYTVSTADVRNIAFGDTRLAGISFVNNTKLTMDVQLGPINFQVLPGDKAKVSYSALFRQNRSLNIEIIVTARYNIGTVRGARTSWDYAQWYDPYGNSSTVSEKVVLIELNSEKTEIWLR